MKLPFATALLSMSLFGCHELDRTSAPVETLEHRTWVETLSVDGEINAEEKTPLNVPGSGWESRELIELVHDGSIVSKGQVVARFDAPRARMELSQAEAELLRKQLSEVGAAAATALTQSQLATESAKLDTDLTLSERYANADLTFLARNQILDALQDVQFLTTKRGYLQWKAGQVDVRSATDHAVLVSQKESVALTAAQKRKSLAALDLLAPHDGVFQLVARWDGTKPQIGASLWTGQEFGSLPNLDKLVARFSVAEGQAFGLKAGLPVRVRLMGTGLEVDLVITKVGSGASTKTRDSPVKYTDFDAAIERDVVRRLELKPGQALRGTVQLVNQPRALTVPNVALLQEGAEFAVWVADGSGRRKQRVVVGTRGPIRSEVRSGLALGAQVLLLPDTAGQQR
jgi:HlyD family secretion protein